MSENKNISPDTLNAMLKMASSKLGMTPEQLKATITDPKKADQLLNSLDKKNGGKIKSAANDQKSLEQMLNSNPKAKKLLNELLGEKDHG